MCIRDSAHRAVCLPAARFRSGRHALLLVGGEFLWRGGLRPPARRECDHAGGQGGGELTDGTGAIQFLKELVKNYLLIRHEADVLRDSVEWRKGRRQRGSHQYRLHRYERQSCAYIE